MSGQYSSIRPFFHDLWSKLLIQVDRSRRRTPHASAVLAQAAQGTVESRETRKNMIEHFLER